MWLSIYTWVGGGRTSVYTSRKLIQYTAQIYTHMNKHVCTSLPASVRNLAFIARVWRGLGTSRVQAHGGFCALPSLAGGHSKAHNA